jgi:hypothetical protein
MLADELPDATFVEAHNILEWRRHPERLDELATGFVDRCFAGSGGARQLRHR